MHIKTCAASFDNITFFLCSPSDSNLSCGIQIRVDGGRIASRDARLSESLPINALQSSYRVHSINPAKRRSRKCRSRHFVKARRLWSDPISLFRQSRLRSVIPICSVRVADNSLRRLQPERARRDAADAKEIYRLESCECTRPAPTRHPLSSFHNPSFRCPSFEWPSPAL
jgi:hypothetical protein